MPILQIIVRGDDKIIRYVNDGEACNYCDNKFYTMNIERENLINENAKYLSLKQLNIRAL